MDSLFHFVFAIVAGMAVNVRLNHRFRWIVLIAFSAVLIDIDHVLFAYPRTFHTVFVTVMVPAVLFAAAYRYESGTDEITYQSLVILLFVMLNGHLAADLLSGGTLLPLYPVSLEPLTVPASATVSVIREDWFIIAPEGIALAAYTGIIGAAYFTEELIVLVERQHQSIQQAVTTVLGR